jgi:hypothetical protein
MRSRGRVQLERPRRHQFLVNAPLDVAQVGDMHREGLLCVRGQSMAIPPSTGTVVPVMNPLSSPA